MVKISRKTIRSKKTARKRTDHPAGCRVNDTELATVRKDIEELTEIGGIKPSLGAYTKHALLSHARYRRMEVKLRELTDEVRSAAEQARFTEGGEAAAGKLGAIFTRMSGLLEASR